MDTSALDRQNEEFDALTRLSKAWSTLQKVSVVDDDYPEYRHKYEGALKDFVQAMQNNKRFVTHKESGSEGQFSPWLPMTRPIDVGMIGKLLEELGELMSVTARCLIQGMNEIDPSTGKINRERLTGEVGDVISKIDAISEHFKLDRSAIGMRAYKKTAFHKGWWEFLKGQSR